MGVACCTTTADFSQEHGDALHCQTNFKIDFIKSIRAKGFKI
jgi:hypothetical protein